MKIINKALYLIIFSGILFYSCGSGSQSTEATEAESAPESMIEEEKPMYEIRDDQKVFFVNLEDGAEINSPVTVQMGVEGMELEPAGAIKENYGHHHIIIDGSFIPVGQVVPADETHIHYGDGRSETDLELTPGEHTLTLQYADGVHQSYGEKMSATITVTVVE
jgi:hypothetical protein